MARISLNNNLPSTGKRSKRTKYVHLIIRGSAWPSFFLYARLVFYINNKITKKERDMNNITTRNVAFFDAEFTAKSEKNRGVQEMIQCAFIVYQIEVSEDDKLISVDEQPLFTYNTFVRPIYNQELSDYIKELTGIKQDEVDSGKSFDDVICDVNSAINEWRVTDILTWGPDKLLFRNNCNVVNCDKRKSNYICRKFVDVSGKLSDYFGYDVVISQHKVCQLLGVEEIGNRHDAYSDAINLSQIIKELCGQICL